jgi:hypothetical protein
MDKTKHINYKEGTTYHLQDLFVIAYYPLIKTCEADELRMYEYLKLYAINKHSAFPSMTTIGKDLGISRFSIMRTLKKMEVKKRLIVDRTDKNSRGNIYDITWYDLLNRPVDKSGTTGGKVVAKSHNKTCENATLTNINKTNINIYNNKDKKIFSKLSFRGMPVVKDKFTGKLKAYDNQEWCEIDERCLHEVINNK